MNRELYKQLLTILATYDYNQPNGFYSLFKYAKRAGLRGLSFHDFTKHVQAMGVRSVVKRVDGVVSRSILHDAKADVYIREIFPELETCPNCNGVGMVKIKL